MANKEWLKKGADGLTFGERLEDLIKLNKTTATAVATATGIAQSGMSNYINHRSAPDCATICILAKYFSVSSDYLLGLSDIPSSDLDIKEIHEKTSLTEENITSLIKHGPFGQCNIPHLVTGYEKLTNDLLNYASTHHAARTYSRFLQNVAIPESPQPKPFGDEHYTCTQIKVVAEILSGTPEDGVDYAKGFVPIPAKEYSKMLLADFLHDLRTYLNNLYFDLDLGVMDNGND